MEKQCGQFKITETDDGYRIDVKGKNLKEMFSCCASMFDQEEESKSTCCAPAQEKK